MYGICPKCLEYKRLTVMVNKIYYCGECFGENINRKIYKRNSGRNGDGYSYPRDNDGPSSSWGNSVKHYEDNIT